MTRSRIVTALLGAVLLVLGSAIPASSFTLDTKVKTARDVAALWNATGYVHIDVGRCSTSEATCIEAAYSKTSCGSAGCSTWSLPYCEIDLTQQVRQYRDNDLIFNVLGHEVGHCLLHSAWHATDNSDIMVGWVGPGQPRRVIGPETMAQLQAAYALAA